MGLGAGTVEDMGLTPEFWRGRRVFLTGHTGFKGSWLSLWLQSLGADVTGYALAAEPGSLFERARVAAGMRSVVGDIQDRAALQHALAAAAPEVVIHMAAQALVRQSYADPLGTFATNILGTACLLDALRHQPGVRALVNVTSDKCYENREWLWGYRENESLGGHDPYSASKACAEIVGAAMRASYFPSEAHGVHGVAIASARAGNVIGGGDTARDRLVPDVLAAFAEARPAIIRNPRSVRPWQFVLEPLAGYLLLAERLYADGVAYAEAWNFGPRDEDMQPVSTLVRSMVAAWGENASWVQDPLTHPHEALTLRLDATKARLRLGWVPRWTLTQTLEAIIDWQRAAMAGKDMHEVTMQQIRAWESSARPDYYPSAD